MHPAMAGCFLLQAIRKSPQMRGLILSIGKLQFYAAVFL